MASGAFLAGAQAGSGDAAGQEANKGPTWSDYVQWYKVGSSHVWPVAQTEAVPGALQQGRGARVSSYPLIQGYVQQLAPLLVQAQFDSKSEAGKKIVDLWVVIVSADRLCLLSSVHSQADAFN